MDIVRVSSGGGGGGVGFLEICVFTDKRSLLQCTFIREDGRRGGKLRLSLNAAPKENLFARVCIYCVFVWESVACACSSARPN